MAPRLGVKRHGFPCQSDRSTRWLRTAISVRSGTLKFLDKLLAMQLAPVSFVAFLPVLRMGDETPIGLPISADVAFPICSQLRQHAGLILIMRHPVWIRGPVMSR